MLYDLKELARRKRKVPNFKNVSPVNLLKQTLPEEHRHHIDYSKIYFAKTKHCYPPAGRNIPTLVCSCRETMMKLLYMLKMEGMVPAEFAVTTLDAKFPWYNPEMKIIKPFRPNAIYRYVENKYETRTGSDQINGGNDTASNIGLLFDVDNHVDNTLHVGSDATTDLVLEAETLPVDNFIEEEQEMITDNAVMTFNHGEWEIKAIEVDGKPYFPATITAQTLGYTNPQKAIRDHCKEAGCTIRSVSYESGSKKIKFINEANLYRLIMRSNLAAAEAFQDWVVEEVLPSIRQHGKYEAPKMDMDPLDIAEQDAKMRIKLIQEIRKQNEKIAQLEAIPSRVNDALKDNARKADFPPNLIRVTDLPKRFGGGVSDVVLRDCYDYVKHPRGDYVALDKNGDPREVTCFQRAGLDEVELEWLEKVQIVRHTDKNYICQHPWHNKGNGVFWLKRDVVELDQKFWGPLLRHYWKRQPENEQPESFRKNKDKKND